MADKLAFGSYIAGQSPVHTMNAQVKVILACVFSIAVLFIGTWLGMCLSALLVLCGYLVSKIRLSKALNGCKAVALILVFTILAHAFTLNVSALSENPLEPGALGLGAGVAIWGDFGVTADGFLAGLFFAARIALILCACSLLTFTTSNVELTDGLSSLLKPLRRLHVPVDDVATIVAMALRFVPTVTAQYHRIANCQKARCARLEDGNIAQRIRAWFPVLTPLMVRLFKRSDELACAMDARGYGVGMRSHMRHSACKPREIVVLLALCAGIILICAIL